MVKPDPTRPPARLARYCWWRRHSRACGHRFCGAIRSPLLYKRAWEERVTRQREDTYVGHNRSMTVVKPRLTYPFTATRTPSTLWMYPTSAGVSCCLKEHQLARSNQKWRKALLYSQLSQPRYTHVAGQHAYKPASSGSSQHYIIQCTYGMHVAEGPLCYQRYRLTDMHASRLVYHCENYCMYVAVWECKLNVKGRCDQNIIDAMVAYLCLL